MFFVIVPFLVSKGVDFTTGHIFSFFPAGLTQASGSLLCFWSLGLELAWFRLCIPQGSISFCWQPLGPQLHEPDWQNSGVPRALTSETHVNRWGSLKHMLTVQFPRVSRCASKEGLLDGEICAALCGGARSSMPPLCIWF